MKPVVFHPEADAEVIAAARWYEDRHPGLGSEFLDEIDAGTSRISSAPEAFGILSDDIRCHLLHRFPYGLLYQIHPDRIFIVAVMHLHREPRYWRDRV